MTELLVKIFKNRLLSAFLVTLVAVVLALTLEALDAWQTLELKTYDLRFSLRGAVDEKESGIVIVAVDDQSFASLRQKWPFPRHLFARAIHNLKNAGARLIVFDVEFTEPDSKFPEDDLALARAARDAGNVLFAAKVVNEFRYNQVENAYLLKPIDPLLESNCKWALINVIEDMDGFIRRYLLFQKFGNTAYYPLAVKAYLESFEIKTPPSVADGVFNLGNLDIPTADRNTFFVNYSGSAGTFPTYSLADVIDDHDYDLGHEEDTDIFELHKEWGTFKDKVVFIGATAEELQDNKLTPFFSHAGHKRKMPGVEVHANAFRTLTSGRFIRQIDFRLQAIVMFLLAFILAYVGLRARPLIGSAIITLTVMVYLGVAYALFVRNLFWIQIVLPLATIFFSYVGSVVQQVVIERRERGRVKRIFQQFVSKGVVDSMLASGEVPKFGGERRELTVLFSDIRSFTSYCERHSPESVVYSLNEYLTAMVDIIFRYQGTLDKFVGDEIMALYGAPLYFKDHAIQACETACDMIASLRELQKRWSKDARDYFHIGIGINTGKMIVGNLGSQQLFDYTVIGDEVNLAARLESANKQYWTSIIISESTYLHVKKKAMVRELDVVRVKGKKKPVKIFELRSMDALPDIENDLIINVYELGLKLYKEQRWYEAIKQFKRVLRYFPSDGPARVYVKRCLDFIENPPPLSWDGVYEFSSK